MPKHFGIGVTAPSVAAARAIADEVRQELWPDVAALEDVVEDVDLRTLDAGHVLPNMRPPVWPGVWYPMGWEGPPTGRPRER